MVKVDISGITGFLNGEPLDIANCAVQYEKVENHPDARWMRLAETVDTTSLKAAADRIKSNSKVLVVIGIGGSYLGARSAIELIKSPFYNTLRKETPDIYFAGNNVSGEYLEQIISLIGDRDFSVNIISKSGSTMEPGIALRVFRGLLEARYGVAEACARTYITTGAGTSPMRKTTQTGYTYFDIPEGVGGRYSVLSAVGLLPMAVAGIDINAVLNGAKIEQSENRESAFLYAAARQALYRQGKKIEILGCFEPAFRSMGEWWKQLFGESEGKDGIGIFPASVEYSADLHSMGQYIQDGERTLMETFVSFEKPRAQIRIPGASMFDDGLKPLSGKPVCEVNDAAIKAVKAAHIDGGVPVIELSVPAITDESYGALVYFFELSCAVSGMLSGVNPFDQPGVEAYKKNLFSILGLR